MTTQLLETTSNEHIAFQNAWKAATHDVRVKSTLKHSQFTTWRETGWLRSAHHILFNIINNKSIDSGFTNITNCNKLQNSKISANNGLVTAVRELARIQKIAQNINDVKPVSVYVVKRLSDFLEPLNNTISLVDLLALDIPKRIGNEYIKR